MKSIKIILIVILAATLTSCQFDLNIGHENGNGNVVIEERSVTANFDEVRGTSGIDVYLTEGTENKIVVEADENLQNLIETHISNGKLTIRSSKNIGRASAKKVHVTYVVLTGIEASSGADIIVNSVLKGENLSLDASSGSDLEVEVFTKNLSAETSSGADIKISGKASTLDASASSGSELNAKKLQVLTCSAKASSGADITVNVKEKINAKASSGGHIKYYGDPVSVSKKGGPSGSVSKM
ncbi:MAG: head GIN domain-containing protein [Flavobacteriaceae bacterium]